LRELEGEVNNDKDGLNGEDSGEWCKRWTMKTENNDEDSEW
jgi:hypothetical protein